MRGAYAYLHPHARMEELRNVYKVLVWKSDGRIPTWGRKSKWEDNIGTALKLRRCWDAD
jgi:hypothetical protein